MSDEQTPVTPAAAPADAHHAGPEVTAHEAAELATEETVEVAGEIIDAEIVPTPVGSAVSTTPTLPGTPVTSPTGVPAPAFDYTDAGVPTLDYVRDRIEKRWGTAQGSAEIAGATEAAEQQKKRDEDRAELAAEKLAEIRRGLTP